MNPSVARRELGGQGGRGEERGRGGRGRGRGRGRERGKGGEEGGERGREGDGGERGGGGKRGGGGSKNSVIMYVHCTSFCKYSKCFYVYPSLCARQLNTHTHSNIVPQLSYTNESQKR